MSQKIRRKLKPDRRSDVHVDTVMFANADALRDTLLGCAARTQVNGTEDRTSVILAPQDAKLFGIGDVIHFTLQEAYAEVAWYPGPATPDLVSLSSPRFVRPDDVAHIRERYAADRKGLVLELLAEGLINDRRLR